MFLHTTLYSYRRDFFPVFSNQTEDQDVQLLNDKKIITKHADPNKASSGKPVNQGRFGHMEAVYQGRFGHLEAVDRGRFGHLEAVYQGRFGYLEVVYQRFGHLKAMYQGWFDHLVLVRQGRFGHLEAAYVLHVYKMDVHQELKAHNVNWMLQNWQCSDTASCSTYMHKAQILEGQEFELVKPHEKQLYSFRPFRFGFECFVLHLA